MKIYSILLLVLTHTGFATYAANKIEIQSTDGLTISADYYPSKTKPLGVILLCHQAGWSRGEYKETGPWLAALGYDAVAIDQRSGRKINGVKNLVAAQAKKNKLDTNYISAKPDIEAAIQTIAKKFKQKIILLGSSYSAGLAVRLAGEGHPQLKAIAAFSPGEYYDNKSYLQEVVKNIKIPSFITASKKEIGQYQKLWRLIPANVLTLSAPNSKGHHGSRALWKSKAGYQEYRAEFQRFLKSLK